MAGFTGGLHRCVAVTRCERRPAPYSRVAASRCERRAQRLGTRLVDDDHFVLRCFARGAQCSHVRKANETLLLKLRKVQRCAVSL
eukprot:6201269-Pleurochrysis_carterae.AAC.1